MTTTIQTKYTPAVLTRAILDYSEIIRVVDKTSRFSRRDIENLVKSHYMEDGICNYMHRKFRLDVVEDPLTVLCTDRGFPGFGWGPTVMESGSGFAGQKITGLRLRSKAKTLKYLKHRLWKLSQIHLALVRYNSTFVNTEKPRQSVG